MLAAGPVRKCHPASADGRPSSVRYWTRFVAASPGRERRQLARVDAHRDDLELVPGRPGEILHPFDETVQLERAEHGAAVVVERDDDRPAGPEIRAQRHVAPALVLEDEIERQRCAPLL